MKTATSLVHVALRRMTASNPLIKSGNMHQDPNQIRPSEGTPQALLPGDSGGLLVPPQAIRKCTLDHTRARTCGLAQLERGRPSLG